MGDSLISVLRGSTTPRLWTRPNVTGPAGPCGCGCALTEATSKGFEAAKFASLVLGITLLPWQRWLLIHALELNPDGTFRFRVVLVLVARQNGKTLTLQVKALWRLFMDMAQLVIGMAQNLDVAEEAWSGGLEIIEATPDLAAELEHVDRANGKKTLRLTGGRRWKIAAPSRKGGRGLSGDDVNLDELREHQNWLAWAAVSKTTMARRFGQVWGWSNAGDKASVVLNHLQDTARSGLEHPEQADPSFGLFEWSAPDGCAVDDIESIAQANPSLGYTITIEAIMSALATDPPEIYRTEVLCQRVMSMTPQKLPSESWRGCRDPLSTFPGQPVYALDVAWDRSHAAVAAAGIRADGLPHVEVAKHELGTEWVVPWLTERAGKFRTVVVDRTSPAGSLIADLEKAKVALKLAGARDLAQACGALFDGCVTEQLRHLGQNRLDVALKFASARQLGDTWVWDRKGSPVDISPMTSVTLALWGLSTSRPSAPAIAVSDY